MWIRDSTTRVSHWSTWHTCYKNFMTSWHDVMTSSWHAMLLQALFDIEILMQMWIRDSTTRVSLWSTWHTCYKYVMTSCHDVMTLSWHAKTISGTNQHINLISNLFPGFSLTWVGHWATLQHVAVNPWRHGMTSSWHAKLYQVLFNIETWLQIQFVMTSRFLLKITVETFEVEIAPVTAFHVMLTSCRHVMTSCVMRSIATCFKVAQWLTRVVEPLNRIWNHVSMLNIASYSFTCQNDVMTSRHDITSWQHDIL